jgi:hypothetical protein
VFVSLLVGRLSPLQWPLYLMDIVAAFQLVIMVENYSQCFLWIFGCLWASSLMWRYFSNISCSPPMAHAYEWAHQLGFFKYRLDDEFASWLLQSRQDLLEGLGWGFQGGHQDKNTWCSYFSLQSLILSRLLLDSHHENSQTCSYLHLWGEPLIHQLTSLRLLSSPLVFRNIQPQYLCSSLVSNKLESLYINFLFNQTSYLPTLGCFLRFYTRRILLFPLHIMISFIFISRVF